MKQLRSVDIVDIDEFGDYALASGLSVLRAATLMFFLWFPHRLLEFSHFLSYWFFNSSHDYQIIFTAGGKELSLRKTRKMKLY